MDSSSGSTVSILLRPRVVSVAIITATAAVSIGAGIWYESWRRSRAETTERPGGGLHRRNAIRRTRRASLINGPNGTAADTPTADDDASLAAAPPTTDENAVDLNNVRPLQGTSGGEDRDGTVVDDGEVDERWLDDMTQAAVVHRAGHNIVNLLFRVSEDNARRSAYVHRGCACNACGIVPIRGIRYRCANCADFDLCETCESQGLHIKTHIFYKVKVPAPPFGPRQMQPVWYPGDPDACVRSLPKSLITRLSRETGFERQELEAFWEQWTYMANTEWREDPDGLGLAMDRKTFERCLVPSGGYRHAAPNLIHDRMFAFYDTNNDDLIGFSEFLHGLSYRKRKDKLRKIFDGYDTDRDGLVSRRDFLRFFRAYYVLYKQMHKDILEGLDDQVMSSIETHQLVGNRQALSSLFGREGRVPQAEMRRMLSGKTIDNETGELLVADSAAGVVANDRPDMARREDILSRLFTRSETRMRSEGIFEERFFTSGDNSGDEHEEGMAEVNYWNALLNPPRSVQDIPSLLIGESELSGLNDDIFVSNEDNEYEEGDDTLPLRSDILVDLVAGTSRNNGDTTGNEMATTPATAPAAVVVDQEPPAEQPTIPTAGPSLAPAQTVTTGAPARLSSTNVPPGRGEGLSHLDSDMQEQQDAAGGNTRVRLNTWRVPTNGQLRAQQEAFVRAQMTKVARVTARRKLHNRWMRRNFYLDEEEGATAPGGWKDDGDILATQAELAPGEAAGVGDPSSASKVRFAKDADAAVATEEGDHETQSGPAKPGQQQQWGGSGSHMEVPEAERDAGREILYQVMQQAFNELLDILFLNKEDLAVASAESKEDRDKYRHLFDNIDVENDAASSSHAASDDKAAKQPSPAGGKRSAASNRPPSELTLEEMLAQTGYQVIGHTTEIEGEGQGEASEAVEANTAEIAVVEEVLGEATEEKEEGAAVEPPKEDDVQEPAEPIIPEVHADDADDANTVEPEAETAAVGGITESPAADVLVTLDDVPEISLTPVAAAVEAEADGYKDPTLPQFRPNSEAEYVAMLQDQAQDQAQAQAQAQSPSQVPSQAASLVAASTAATVATSSEGRSSPGTATPPVEEAAAAAIVADDDKNDSRDTQEQPQPQPSAETSAGGQKEGEEKEEQKQKNKDTELPNESNDKRKGKGKEKERAASGEKSEAHPPTFVHETLVEWKRLDMAEQEAMVRGGWGKLSYAEFEVIFKQEELSSNRLDYLGSWIDFCIP